MPEVTCQTCKVLFERRTGLVHKYNFCCKEHFRQWCSQRMTDYNRTENPMNRPGVPLSVRLKRSRALRGRGAGTTYKKLLGGYEHRKVAEAVIGRALIAGEVVHHIDGDLQNNEPLNLEVLASQSVHVGEHKRDEKGRWCK